MFIAMNRFQVLSSKEAEFEAMWAGRDSYLADVPGFTAFHLIRGSSSDEATLYATHTVWNSRQDFENWTKSEAFRAAHAGVGSTRDLYAGAPKLELFDAVQGITA